MIAAILTEDNYFAELIFDKLIAGRRREMTQRKRKVCGKLDASAG